MIRKIIKEFLIKPIWAVVIIIIAIFGNIDDLLSLFGIDLSINAEPLLRNKVTEFFHVYWWALSIILMLLAVTVGLFRKTRFFLGDRVIAKNVSIVPIVDNPASGEMYAWLCINNGEFVDLTDCYADIKKIIMKYGDSWYQWTQETNTNLSKLTWPDFQDHKSVVIRRNNKARLNIVRTNLRTRLVLIVEKGDESLVGPKIYVEVGINGEMEGKPIVELLFQGFIMMETRLIPSQTYLEKIAKTSPNGEQIIDEYERIAPPTTYQKLHFNPGIFDESIEIF